MVSMLTPITFWLVISGIDDLVLTLLWVRFWFKPGDPTPDVSSTPEKLLAIFVPLWKEHEVVRQMVGHNITAIRYSAYHFFIGGYPNDTETLDAIRSMEDRFPNVHLSLVPHDGPTSKADCLNWAYQTMLLFEETHQIRFAGVITHDAEDLVHPDSLRWINHYIDRYGMVQVPVLALPTPLREFVHGVYIDEFSEFQVRDLLVRQSVGGFLPSSGVGTGFARDALERLAASSKNRIFEPGCLTEDYENGFRLHRLGCPQALLPLHMGNHFPVATREYFPRTWNAAIRQRTRWVTGIAWQGMERHGFQGGPRQWWWHWRDRKGLIGNPTGAACHLLFLYGLVTLLVETPWQFGELVRQSPTAAMLPFTFAVAAVQLVSRVTIVQGLYGWRTALGSPFRVPVANWINASAAVRATWGYIRSKIKREQLAWLKTQHQYPNRFALEAHRPTLTEVLMKTSYISDDQMREAVSTKPPGRRLGDWLVERGLLSEADLYEAMCLQLCLPVSVVRPETLSRETVRSLPAHVIKEWELVPVGIEQEELILAGPEAPPEAVHESLEQYTRLKVRFNLVPRSTFDEILQRHL